VGMLSDGGGIELRKLGGGGGGGAATRGDSGGGLSDAHGEVTGERGESGSNQRRRGGKTWHRTTGWLRA
jgi:hypothetical protein